MHVSTISLQMRRRLVVVCLLGAVACSSTPSNTAPLDARIVGEPSIVPQTVPLEADEPALDQPADAAPPEATSETTSASASSTANTSDTATTEATDTSGSPDSTLEESDGAIPDVLAFRDDDVGGLYEVTSGGALLALADSAGGGASGATVGDGDVVRVTDRLDVRDDTWVEVGPPLGGNPIGWLLAEDLRQTDKSVPINDSQLAGRLVELITERPIRADSRPTSEEVTRRSAGALLVHVGETSLHGSGVTWARVRDLDSGGVLGWVEAGELRRVDEIVLQSSTGEPVRTSPDATLSYGASIVSPEVVSSTCGFTRVRITVAGGSSGGHVLFGPASPRATWDAENATAGTWRAASGGGDLFLPPASSVTLTFPATLSDRWFFATVGPDGQVPHRTDGLGDPVLIDGDQVEAITTQVTTGC